MECARWKDRPIQVYCENPQVCCWGAIGKKKGNVTKNCHVILKFPPSVWAFTESAPSACVCVWSVNVYTCHVDWTGRRPPTLRACRQAASSQTLYTLSLDSGTVPSPRLADPPTAPPAVLFVNNFWFSAGQPLRGVV